MLADTERDMEKRQSKGLKRRQAHMMGPLQVSAIFLKLVMFVIGTPLA